MTTAQIIGLYIAVLAPVVAVGLLYLFAHFAFKR